MTLITYPTRVHFADAVLEHALHSELEKGRVRTALLICDSARADTEFHDRVNDGIPTGAAVLSCRISEGSDLALLARRMAGDGDLAHVDAIIAFGSMSAIEMGRNMRRELRDANGARPAFFAVPGIDGLPDPCTLNLESWRDGLPSVVICDPTLTGAEAPGTSLRAAVITLMRAIESYLGAAYNPPAEGMALDGLSRAIAALPDLADPARGAGLETRRELMAAGLNAAMAQEKGVGPTHLLSRALAAECRGAVSADAARLILPGIIAATRRDARKLATMARLIDSDPDRIDVSLQRALAGLPMRARLSELGLSIQHLKNATRAVAGRDDISERAAEAVLEQAF